MIVLNGMYLTHLCREGLTRMLKFGPAKAGAVSSSLLKNYLELSRMLTVLVKARFDAQVGYLC